MLQVADASICTYICVDNVVALLLSWSKYCHSGSIERNFVSLLTNKDNATLFRILHPTASVHIISSNDVGIVAMFMDTTYIYGWNTMFIPYFTGNVLSWLASNIKTVPIPRCVLIFGLHIVDTTIILLAKSDTGMLSYSWVITIFMAL